MTEVHGGGRHCDDPWHDLPRFLRRDTRQCAKCGQPEPAPLRAQMVDGIPRRSRIDLHTPAEAAIRAAVLAVEDAGAHPLLTDAVNLLAEAGDKVADFVELTPNAEAQPPTNRASGSAVGCSAQLEHNALT